ncbi:MULTISPECIES: helix-turn-helix domain-containing protein [unclassified Providencia]|uniref:helix-turn-helix domain-containing protein n=1 Tax=unclassified Providencia TaxID=2633465 RepID=UPI0012B61C33|nr:MULTISPECIES: helix-turn-helix transcriptional regulator [unclassified Providencia]MTC23680.1 helix-turn-helix domain-containing protein [Providencia sp. wls1938]
MSNRNIGAFIKQKRIEKNISTSEIAKQLTISEAEYARVENGDVSIYVDDLMAIAEVLVVDVSEILEMHERK